MSGDPRQCRMNAVHCAELATRAKAAHLKATLLSLSKNWEKLAIDLERTHALIDEANVDFKKPA